MVKKGLIFIQVYLLSTLALAQQPGNNNQIIASDSTGCVPLLVNFEAQVPNAVSWDWNFGNGNTSTQENPSELFSNDGLFTITLSVTLQDSSVLQFIEVNFIEVVAKPSANASFNAVNFCANNNTIQFQNNTTNATQFIWDFGDGNLSTNFAPNYHYSIPGTYNVNFLATNSAGCMDNITLGNIEIYGSVQNDFQIVGQNQSCDSAYSFQFVAIPNTMNNYTWQFSDGSQYTGTNIQHTFNAYGDFDLLLITEDSNSCLDSTFTNNVVAVTNLSYDFSASSTTNCEMRNNTFIANASGATTVNWDFGDGQQGAGSITTHVYQNSGQYSVTMTATDSSGCSQTIIKNNYIEIFLPPVATVIISDTVVCAGEQILFDLTSTNFQNTNWDFGDGNTSALTSILHEYTNSGLYEAQLLINSPGCIDTITQFINVSQPIAQFQNSVVHNCPPVNVTFMDQTNNALTWKWNFSNGDTSTAQNPVVSFNSSGNYDVELVVTDIAGCTDTLMVNDAVSILNNIPSNFQSAQFSGCNPISISFYNYAIGSGFWNWNFGDGTMSNSPTPNHTYALPGNYVVSLSSMDTSGCNLYIDSFAIVTVNNLVIDSLNLGLNCNNAEVNFSVDCPECVSWLWDYGDSTSSTTMSPTHIYPIHDLFYISFTGVSSLGCVGGVMYAVDLDSCTFQSVLGPAINPMSEEDDGLYGWTPNPYPIVGCPKFEYCGPFTISLYNPMPDADAWTWYFGDGDIGSGATPVHTYDTPGYYSLMLIYDQGGNIDTLYFHNYIKVNGHINGIIVNSLNTCNGIELNLVSQHSTFGHYYWSIDNIPLQNNSPILDTMFVNNNQLHSITLTTNDSSNCSYSASIGIVSNGINPEFIYDTLICLSDSIIITHTIPSEYQTIWKFGDNNLSNILEANYIYTNPGTYNISVNTTDSSGCDMTYNVGIVEVLEPESNFSITSPTSLCVGDTIYVEALQSTNTYYNWDFGNVNLITGGANASAIVLTPGTFDLELETGAYGCSSTSTQPAILVVNQAVADFKFSQNNFCLPITAQFIDLSISPISWNWTFGDGNSSSSQNPVHFFTTEPTSQITLDITDIHGCQASITKINVELFDVTITTNSMVGCAPVPITFIENSQNAIDWFWDFGDGETSIAQNPVHSYQSNGIYDLSLIVTSADGCIDSISYPSMIHIDKVKANFSSSSGGGCAPQAAFFSDSSYNAVSWQWDFNNGFTSTLQNPIQIFYTGGNYSIQLIVESATGCRDTILSSSPLSIIGPASNFTIVDTIVCEYDSVKFLNNSQNAASYTWLFGDGSSSSSFTPSYQYPVSGDYDINLITTDSNGCQNIAMQSAQISIITTPDATFNLSDTLGCSPLFISNNANSSGLQYNWLLNGSSIGSDPYYNDTLLTGNYNLMLITESLHGCKDSSLVSNIVVHRNYTTQLTPLNSICETQDSITVICASNAGNWYLDSIPNPSNIFDVSNLPFGDYQIIQEIVAYCGDADTITLHIDSVISASISTPMEVCEYNDLFLLQASSNIGYWSGQGVINPYSGLFDPGSTNYGNNTLTYTLQNGACTFTDSTVILVKPKPKSVFSVNDLLCEGYKIEIKSPENSPSASYSWIFVSNVDTITSNAATPNISLFSSTWKIVLTVENDGCSSTDSLSGLYVIDSIAPNTPSIIRSTVSEDAVFTEWDKPQYGFEKVSELQVWRSADSVNFSMIDVVDRSETSYLDLNTQVNEQNYYYIIIPTNICKVKPEINDMSSSILLEKQELNGDKILFTWSNYYKWQYGVEYYELQKVDDFGNWITIERINNSSNTVTIEKQ